MNIRAQQNLAKRLLALINTSYPKTAPIVVGGAPRDWYSDRTANDIDIYLRCTADMMKLLIELNRHPSIEILHDFGEGYKYPETTFIKRIARISFSGQVFDLIFAQSSEPLEVLGRFGCSLSEIYWEPDGSYHATAEFKMDMESGYCTFKSGKWRKVTPQYIAKILARGQSKTYFFTTYDSQNLSKDTVGVPSYYTLDQIKENLPFFRPIDTPSSTVEDLFDDSGY